MVVAGISLQRICQLVFLHQPFLAAILGVGDSG